MYLIPLLMLLAMPVQADEETEKVWQQFAFTAVEVLIYTDQLEKLDATVCNRGAGSPYSTRKTRRELMEMVPRARRAALQEMLDSPMVQSLLAENSLGVEAMIGKPELGGSPSDTQRGRCLELALSFSGNREEALADLRKLAQRLQP